MADSRQAPGVNPLRPYYVPPSAGEASSAAAATAITKASSTSAFAFPDIDYSDYMSEPSRSVRSSIKKLLDQAVWRYSTVLMAQPLEVAKLILQVHVAGDDEEEEDDDGKRQPRGRQRGRQGRPPQPQPHPRSRAAGSGPRVPVGRIELKSSHSLLDALSSLTASSGALAMWRGTNASLIYSVLSRALEPFLQSFLAALAGVEPDLVLPLPASTLPVSAAGLSASTPIPSIIISAAACALTSLILAPIDAARTRLILTAEEPRSLLGVLRTLSPSWLIPSHLVPITLLNSTLPSLIAHASPFFFRSYLHLDPITTPTSWSIVSLAASALDLGIKLPLETVLRRAQIATWTAPPTTVAASQSKRKPLTTIVRVPQSYRGIVPTMWGIVREEGYSESQKDKMAHLAGRAPRRRRKGQGTEGLYRGWRVGLWALIGVWGTSLVDGVSAQGGDAGTGGSVHGGKF
ncbi:hypothetical protein DV738_g5605, partial [Chaetothyriales sp. CBS 135597]